MHRCFAENLWRYQEITNRGMERGWKIGSQIKMEMKQVEYFK